MPGLSHHVDLDAAQPAKIGVEAEVGEYLGQVPPHDGFKVARQHAGQRHRAYFGYQHLAIAVQHQRGVEVNRAPYLEPDFIARAEHVIGRHRQPGVGRINLRRIE